MAASPPCRTLAHFGHLEGAKLSEDPIWGIWRSTYVEVTAPAPRRRVGIRVHRSLLAADEATEERGIPVTTVPRTLLDLATVLRTIQLERAHEEAERRALTDALSLPALLARYPRRHGTPGIE